MSAACAERKLVTSEDIEDLLKRVATDFSGLPAWIVKSVGGSTLHWAGASLRFQEHEFKVKTEYGDIAGANLLDWIDSRDSKDIISISVTRDNSSENLNSWLKKRKNIIDKNKGILWNVIGPEGGWSKSEIEFFIKNKIPFVKLSETILRTPTATVNATSILNQWRNDFKLINNL